MLITDDLNVLIYPTYQTSGQKEERKIRIQWHQIDLMTIFRMLQQNPKEYKFYSAAHRLLKIDHIFVQHAKLYKFRKLKKHHSILSENNALNLKLKLKIHIKQISSKYRNS